MRESWEGVTVLFRSSRQVSRIMSKLREKLACAFLNPALKSPSEFSHGWDYFCHAFSHVWTGMRVGRSGTTK